MRLKRTVALLAAVIMITCLLPQNVSAEKSSNVKVTFNFGDSELLKNGCLLMADERNEDWWYISVQVDGAEEGTEPVIVSENEELVTGEVYWFDSYSGEGQIALEKKQGASGICKVTLKYKDASASVTVISPPSSLEIKKIRQKSNSQVYLQWKKFEKADGYRIYCYRDYGDWLEFPEQIKLIKSGSTTSFKLPFEKDPGTYCFNVIPYFIKADGQREPAADLWNYYEEDYTAFEFERLEAPIPKLKASGSQITIGWKKDSRIASYSLYRADSDNGTYKKIFSTKTETSYTDKGKAGRAFTYRLKVTFKDGTKTTGSSRSIYLPKAGKSKSKTLVSDLNLWAGDQYQYSENWASPPDMVYYKQDGQMFMICQGYNEITVFRITSALKLQKIKTIKIDCDVMGTVYPAEDGNFYVACGYNNLDEKDNKTVIKIVKFDKNWNKKKTASIKSGGSVYCPFEGGNVSMAMRGKYLFLFTARTMYDHGDGLHHQACIGVLVNTKTMQGRHFSPTYSSHSFNQKAVFKDDTLYTAEHGDAYPRTVKVTITENFSAQPEAEYISSQSYDVFEILGETGDNYTGLTLGDMAVGKSKVVVAGASKPQGYAIKGVTGNDYELKDNIFFATVDRKSGEVKRTWITKNHPKKSKISIDECRMLKLDDEHFVIIYGQSENNQEATVVKVVNEAGKVLSSKKYDGYVFDGGPMPVLWGGRLFWTANKWSDKQQKSILKAYLVPITY